MIDFRYHLVSIIAIFMALAVGIVLGAGPLKEDIGTALTSDLTRLRQEKADLNDQLAASRRQVAAGESYATATRAQVLRGRLTGKHVALVVPVGADDRVISGVESAIEDAGGTVSSIARLSQEWTRPEAAGELPRTATQLAGSLALDPADLPTDRLPGAVLGRTLLSSTAKDGYHADAPSVTQALTTLKDKGLITVTDQNPATPTLAVAVAAPLERLGTQPADPQVKDYAALVQGLDGAGDGAVLVSPTRPAGDAGATSAAAVVSGVRAQQPVAGVVSTVDDADTAMGQVATVLALVDEQAGRTGRFGTGTDADSVLPDLER